MSTRGGNILIVTHYYPPHIGGIEIVAQQQARSFIKAGKKVSVVTCVSSNDSPGTLNEDGIIVHRVPVVNFFDARFAIPFPLGGIRLASLLSKEVSKADTVYLHDVFYEPSWFAYIFSRLYKKPIFLTQHVAIVHHRNKLVELIQRAVYATWGKLIFRYSKGIIVYNKNVETFLLERKVDPAKILEIRNGINLSTFYPARSSEKKELRRHFGLPLEKPLVLFVGRFVHKKGFMNLLNANSPDYDLLLAGSGDIAAEWANVPGIHIIGSLEQEELAKLYRTADIFVLPAKGEIFTLAMQEAMASGLPIITESDPGYKHYDIDRNLILFNECSPEILRENIKRLMSDKFLLKKMSTYSIEMAKKWFDWEANFNKSTDFNSIKKVPSLTIIAPYFYPKIGGVEIYAYNVAKRLQESGKYRVSIITSNDIGRPYEKGAIDGMTIHRLPVSFRISNTPINLRWYWYIKKIFVLEETDIIHAHSPVVFMADIAASAAKGRPFVITYHSGGMAKGKWPIDTIIYFYERVFLRRLFRRADAIISYYKNFSKQKLDQFSSKTYIIPPGVDIDRFKATPLPPNTKIAMFLGRIDHSSNWKGIEQFLQAMVLVKEKYSHSILELVGGGDAVEHYRRRAIELGIGSSVIFAGPQMGDNLVRAYQRASVVVLPSTSDSESFGMVLIEAMASGRPVIGSDIGGIPGVIDNGQDGLLVSPRNPRALAAALMKIFSDNNFAKELASKGVEKARQFNWDSNTEKYDKIFETLLENVHHS